MAPASCAGVSTRGHRTGVAPICRYCCVASTASACAAAPRTDARVRRRLERRSGEAARWPEVRRGRAWHWSAWEPGDERRQSARREGRIDQAWPLQTLTMPVLQAREIPWWAINWWAWESPLLPQHRRLVTEESAACLRGGRCSFSPNSAALCERRQWKTIKEDPGQQSNSYLSRPFG
jgi:hypothetical protein